MTCPVQRLFGVVSRLTRSLFSRLQPLGKIVQAPLDRALVRSRSFEIVSVERLLAFPNSLTQTIARHSFGGVAQLPCRPLLSGPKSSRRLFNILLQPVHGIGERVLAFPQLFTGPLRVGILPATPRQVLDVFGNLPLPRSSLGRALAQFTDLLLTSRRAGLARLTI